MGFLTLLQIKRLITLKLIHTEYNLLHNNIDIIRHNGYILRIDCNNAESKIQSTPNSQWYLNALTIDNPLEYTQSMLNDAMQAWVDA